MILTEQCNEGKPACEYCGHTGRSCEYPAQEEPVKIRNKLSIIGVYTLKEIDLPGEVPSRESSLFSVSLSSPMLSSYGTTPDKDFDTLEELGNETYNRYDIKDINDGAIDWPLENGAVRKGNRVVLENELALERNVAIRSRDEEYRRSFEQILYNQMLHDPPSQLSISRFEYRLLDFFDHFCSPMFSYGVNIQVQKVWKDRVPGLFMTSPLVRSAVFSFAALNLFPLCDLNRVCETNTMRSEIFSQSGLHDTVNFNPLMSLGDNLAVLHNDSTNYFLQAINYTKDIVGGSVAKNAVTRQNASELAISSVLIFTFTCMQPRGVTPLVCWDGSESDLISLTRGISTIRLQCVALLENSEFGGIFDLEEELATLHKAACPLIHALHDDFLKEYSNTDEFTTESFIEIEALETCLTTLHNLILRSVTFDYPVPLFKWPLLIEDDFRALIYSQNFYALRITFVYSCLSSFLRFELYPDDNVWLDYMRAYKQYNWDLYGGWKYEWDAALYVIAHDQLSKFKTTGDLATFDPLDPNCQVYLTTLENEYRFLHKLNIRS